MKHSLFWAAVEATAKTARTGLHAARAGFDAVGALVDCGIPRQHAGAPWLEAFEEENAVLEVPLSADFTDEAVQCFSCGHTENAHGDGSGKGCYFCGCLENPEPPVAMRSAGQTKQFGPRPRISTATPQNSRTNAGATSSRAVEEGLTEGASPPAAPFVSAADLSWVHHVIPEITAVLADHNPARQIGPWIVCCEHEDGDLCAEFTDMQDWRDHVSGLIAERIEAVTLQLPEEA